MPQPVDHIFGNPSDSSDTTCARRLLKIPLEQLKIINSIPVRPFSSNADATDKVSVKSSTIKEVPYETMGSSLSFQSANSAEKEKFNQASSPIEECKENEKVIMPRKTNYNSPAKKQSLLRNSSLCVLSDPETSDDNSKLQSSNSAPAIFESHMSNPNLTSAELHKISAISSPTIVRVSKLSRSNITQKEQVNSCNDYDPMAEKKRSISQIENNENSPGTTKSPLKLDDHILNHEFLKGSNDFDADKLINKESFSNISVQCGNDPNPILKKRLLLLEKRFSPSKELCRPSSEENISVVKDQTLSAIDNSKIKIPSQVKCSAEVSQNDDGIPLGELCRKINPEKDIENATLVTQIAVQSSIKNIHEAMNSKLDNTNIGCKSQCLVNEKLIISHEESFGSQPVPCGQRFAEQSNVKIMNKSQVTTANVPEKVFQISNVVASSENNEEKIRMLDVAISNSHKVGAKRKRKSKGGVPKNIVRSKNAKTIDIHFTSEQVRIMLDLIKSFHLEV